MAPCLIGQDPITFSNTVVLPLPKKVGKVCQNENRAIKLQLDEKISEKGVKTIKIGFPSANMCI